MFINVNSKFWAISFISLIIVPHETVWTVVFDFVNNLKRAKG